MVDKAELAKVCPAQIFVGQKDVLLRDSIGYNEKLNNAGASLHLVIFADSDHSHIWKYYKSLEEISNRLAASIKDESYLNNLKADKL